VGLKKQVKLLKFYYLAYGRGNSFLKLRPSSLPI
jgi:hypothetical protein